jgi:hypothetical protein
MDGIGGRIIGCPFCLFSSILYPPSFDDDEELLDALLEDDDDFDAFELFMLVLGGKGR